MCNEVTHGGPIVSFRIGADGAGKINHVIRRLIFEPHDISSNFGEEKKARDQV